MFSATPNSCLQRIKAEGILPTNRKEHAAQRRTCARECKSFGPDDRLVFEEPLFPPEDEQPAAVSQVGPLGLMSCGDAANPLRHELGKLGVGTDLTEAKLGSVAAQAFPATELELLAEECEPLPSVPPHVPSTHLSCVQ